MIKLGIVTGIPPAWVLAQTVTDPSTFFQNLGVAGVVLFVAWLWLRDMMKQRDRAVEQLAGIQPVLIEVQHALQQSNTAHIAGAEAAKALTRVLQDLPEPKVWFGIERALLDLERNKEG